MIAAFFIIGLPLIAMFALAAHAVHIDGQREAAHRAHMKRMELAHQWSQAAVRQDHIDHMARIQARHLENMKQIADCSAIHSAEHIVRMEAIRAGAL